MRSLLGALAALCIASASYAEPVLPDNFINSAFCPGSSSSTGGFKSPNSCSENGGNVQVSGTYTTLEMRGETDSSAPQNDRNSGIPAAGPVWSARDSILAMPLDSSLLGQSGTIAFTFDFNGHISPSPSDTPFTEPSWTFEVAQLTRSGSNSTLSRQLLLDTDFELFDESGNSLGSPRLLPGGLVSVRNRSGQAADFAGTVSGEFDIVFGEYLTYELRSDLRLFGPNQLAEVFPSSGLSEFRVLDESGRLIEAILTSDSGTDYNPFVAPVPVPAALPLFASAIAVFGWLGWRRRRAAA